MHTYIHAYIHTYFIVPMQGQRERERERETERPRDRQSERHRENTQGRTHRDRAAAWRRRRRHVYLMTDGLVTCLILAMFLNVLNKDRVPVHVESGRVRCGV